MSNKMQELVNLTPEQAKAWKRLVRAHNDFEKAGGRLYHNTESIYAYNGKHISHIDNADSFSDENLTSDVDMPSIITSLDSFADDAHVFVLKDDIKNND